MKRAFIFVILVLFLFGCSTFSAKIVNEKTAKSTEIITEPPGAVIEINHEYVGKSPLNVEITWDEWTNENIVIVAIPTQEGQYSQEKVIEFNSYGRIPKRIYFNMGLHQVEPTKKYKIDMP